MKERSKRRSLITITGLEVPATTQLDEQFQSVATNLLDYQVPLSSVVSIRREKKLYMATVLDPDLKKTAG